MAICKKCGAEIADDALVCDACGEANVPDASANNDANNNASTSDEVADTVNKAVDGAKDAINNFNNTEDTTSDYDPEDVKNNKVFAVLAYFGILVLVPILAAPKSAFARYHANQGLVLLIAGIILNVVRGILDGIPVVGGIVSIAVGILLLVLFIIGIINAANGRAKELPIIGKIKILK